MLAPDNCCSVHGVCPRRGFRVTAIDVTPQLLAQTQAMAAECRVTVNTLSAKSAHAKLKDGQADVMTVMRESQIVSPCSCLRAWWTHGTPFSSATAHCITECRHDVTALPGPSLWLVVPSLQPLWSIAFGQFLDEWLLSSPCGGTARHQPARRCQV